MWPQETSVASLRVLKRPSPCDWAESAESCTRSPKKIRSLEEEGHQHRFASSSAQKMVPTLVVVMLNLQKKHLDAEMKLGENIHYQVMDQW